MEKITIKLSQDQAQCVLSALRLSKEIRPSAFGMRELTAESVIEYAIELAKETRKTRGMSYTEANYLNHNEWTIVDVSTVGLDGYEITWKRKN